MTLKAVVGGSTAAAGTVTTAGTLTAGQVAYGSGTQTITSSTTFTYNDTTKVLLVGDGSSTGTLNAVALRNPGGTLFLGGSGSNALQVGATGITTGNALYTAAAPATAAAQVSFGSTVAATATAGAGAALPVTVEGYLIISVAGTARKVPYYAT